MLLNTVLPSVSALKYSAELYTFVNVRNYKLHKLCGVAVYGGNVAHETGAGAILSPSLHSD